MTSRDFIYWLQGLFELAEPGALNAKQTDLIRRHLAMVFKHEIDASYGDTAHQEALNALHNTGKPENLPIAHDHVHLDQVLFRC
jgi:hypothetical protein